MNGNLLREVSEWFIRRNGLPLGEDERIEQPHHEAQNGRLSDIETSIHSFEDRNLDVTSREVDFSETDLIVILSRKYNRLILNEAEMAARLQKEFGYDVKIVSNEQYNFEEQIRYMRRARMVFGMHGSILIMGMFCRRGTVLVEMFPFGVPPGKQTKQKRDI